MVIPLFFQEEMASEGEGKDSRFVFVSSSWVKNYLGFLIVKVSKMKESPFRLPLVSRRRNGFARLMVGGLMIAAKAVRLSLPQ